MSDTALSPLGSRAAPLAPAGAVRFVAEHISRDRLPGLAGPWAELAARAAEPNALMEPAFALAALTHLADAAPFEAVAVWREVAGERRLVALMVLRLASRRWGLPLGLAEAMAHNYGPLGTPLLDREHGLPAAEALLAFLRARPAGRRFLLLPFLNEDGAAAALLAEAMRRQSLRHAVFGRFARTLAAPGAPGRYLDASLPAKRRRHLARLRRQLEARGTLTHEVAVAPPAVAAAVEAFLTLEEAGWKGRIGTATTQRPDRRAFLTAAMAGMAEAGRIRVHLHNLDGRPIAAGIALLSQHRAWYWKTAYDEAFAAISPGVQLTLDLTDDLLSLPGLDSIDSLADPDHPMIGHLWREHLTMAHWLVDLTPGGSALFLLAAALENLRRTGRERLVALRNRLRKGR